MGKTDLIVKQLPKSGIKIYLLIVLIAFFSSADSNAQTWKEADDFHWTLAFTYHPMKDDGNFEPIHSRSSELYERALAMEQAKLPDCVKEEEVTKELIHSLAVKTKALDDGVKNGGSNDSIRESLEEIHTLFHSIEEKCK